MNGECSFENRKWLSEFVFNQQHFAPSIKCKARPLRSLVLLFILMPRSIISSASAINPFSGATQTTDYTHLTQSSYRQSARWFQYNFDTQFQHSHNRQSIRKRCPWIYSRAWGCASRQGSGTTASTWAGNRARMIIVLSIMNAGQVVIGIGNAFLSSFFSAMASASEAYCRAESKLHWTAWKKA